MVHVPLEGALEHVADLQVPAQRADVHGLALVCLRGVIRHDAKIGITRQVGDRIEGEAFGEAQVRSIGRNAFEGQNGDCGRARQRGRRSGKHPGSCCGGQDDEQQRNGCYGAATTMRAASQGWRLRCIHHSRSNRRRRHGRGGSRCGSG